MNLVNAEKPDILADLFLQHYGFVVACARRYVHVPEQVEDVVQQVFVEFVSYPKRWRLDGDISPLLYQITKNIANVMIQEQYRHAPDKVREVAEFFGKIVQKDENEENDLLQDQLNALNQCMERLPEKSRELIDRHYRQKTTLRAIAESMGIDEKNLSKKICRIRAALKECIDLKIRVSTR